MRFFYFYPSKHNREKYVKESQEITIHDYAIICDAKPIYFKFETELAPFLIRDDFPRKRKLNWFSICLRVVKKNLSQPEHCICTCYNF